MQGQIKSKEREISVKEKDFRERLRNLQTEEFIDEDFPHLYEKIYDPSLPIDQIEQVIWVACQELHHEPYYSKDFTIKEIKQMNFVCNNINNALILIKIFAQKAFDKLEKQRELNYQFQNRLFKHLHSFEVFLDKEISKVWIDSFVPVSQKRNKEIFSETLNGFILPCIIQKLLAKVCNGYHKIHSLKIYEIIQIFTSYPIEKIKIQQFFTLDSIKQQEQISKVQELMGKVINKEKSLVFFRTKKNFKLQLMGLKPNHPYFIVKPLKKSYKQTQVKGISFLQLPEKQLNGLKRQQWIGKLSKYRTQSEPQQFYDIQNKELMEYENFMLIKDMIQVTRQLIILHNTADWSIQSKVLNLQNYKNLSKSYKQKYNKNIIQKNLKSEIIKLNSESQQLLEPQILSFNLNDSKKRQSKQYQQSKYQQIKQAESVKINRQIFLIYDYLEIQLDNYQKPQQNNLFNDQNLLQKLFINLRVTHQYQNQDNSKIKTIFGKCSLIFFQNQHLISDQKILGTKNTYVKCSSLNKIKFFDLFINLSSTKLKLHSPLSLIILLDGFSTHNSAKELKINLKTTVFANLGREKYHDQIKINSVQQPQAFYEKLQKIIKKIVLIPQLNTSQNMNHKDFQVQIICKQLIDKLNLGVIYINSNHQQIKTENKKNPQDITLQLQINTEIMLRNGIYLVQNIRQAQYYHFDSDKRVLSYRILLTKHNPEFILVFRICQLSRQNSESFNQAQRVLQFPPLNSIKISRIYSANF